jgi:type I restriction enzyme M protein
MGSEDRASLAKTLWESADALRKNIDAAEYKHIVLGLIFLKYISDAFEELYVKLERGEGDYEGADSEDKEEYTAENVFFVPPSSRWKYLRARAKSSEVGADIDAAMEAIEKDNRALRGVLPKVYARGNIDAMSLGRLIDEFSNLDLRGGSVGSDVLGYVFEYFLGEFALAEGKKGGQFYTPGSVVRLLVEMMEPYEGRIYDPCCGSGGMFVQSEKFVKEHQGRVRDISIYGQESNQTTWRLAKMNLVVRRIDSSQVLWNSEGSFLRDAHPDLKADYVIANPPFNDSNWSGELMQGDGRWKYGVPPAGNANFAWMQHFVHHLSPRGHAGFVMAKGALTSQAGGEGEIRKRLIEEGLLDCVVNLPTKLFLNTQIPASLWFLRRGKTYREGEVLFFDASNEGHLISRKTRELSDEDIERMAKIYHNWRSEDDGYEDIKGFCYSASIGEIDSRDFMLSPGRYVGLEDVEDDFDFDERFSSLRAELEEQMSEESKLNERIMSNLAKIKTNG